MRIGIDGRILGMRQHGGIKTYAKNLLDNLARIDKKNYYVVYSFSQIVIPKQDNFKLVVIPTGLPIARSLLFQQIFLPLRVNFEGFDLFHFLSNTMPIFIPDELPVILTVHDLIDFLDLPFSRRPRYLLLRGYQKNVMPKNIDRADLIIVPSKTVKKSLNSILATPPSKVKVIYEGATLAHSDSPKNCTVANKWKRYFSLPPFLCFASFSPRKNIVRILKAYSALNNEVKNKHKLAIVVSYVPLARFLIEDARRLGIDKNIVFFEKISDEDLIFVYSNSLALVFPSLYEGFGLPVVEAMRNKLPVIVSRNGSLAEIVGNKGVYVDPLLAKSIASGMLRVVKMYAESKQTYKKLQQALYERSESFSWKKCAQETLKVYKKLASG